MSANGDISSFLKGLGEARKRVLEAGRQAVTRAGAHILGQAQVLAPVETGALKASAVAEPATVNGHTITMVLGFNTDYAAAVHERLDLHHAAPTQAKFLETAMRTNTQKFTTYVQDAMRSAL